MLKCVRLLQSKSIYFSSHAPLSTRMRNVDRVNVKVRQGTVSGVKEKLPNGNDFCAFRGIPYAKPPVGELRFRAPQPLERFPYPILDCSVERDVCFSRNMFTQELEGSEDCLHLNVYTPAPERCGNGPLPVMVFIHGGAFLFGSGNGDCYSPEYLLQEDVVVVTLNYRLGSLGFLHLPSHGIEGNAGLKDQLMVLKWVRDNIAQFHGNPNNVTLFGESAGAASVHLHLLSPVSQKYFHKAICQSGMSVMEWVMQLDSVNRAHTLARLIDPAAKSDDDVYQTLMNADKVELMGLMINTLSADEKRRGLPMPFKPVVEESIGPDTVVPMHPFLAMQQPNRIPPIPIIFGNNDREGTIMMLDAVKKLDLYDNDMARMIPRTVNMSPESAASEQLGNEIKRFYCGEKGVTDETINQLADIMTDYHFGILANTGAELHARYQKNSPMFYYNFSYDGELNMYKKLLQLKIPGACHADELSYLFMMRLANYDVKQDSEAGQVRRLMCRMWTNFAKHGHPTPADDESLPCRWEPVDKIPPTTASESFRLKCLDINVKTQMMLDPAKERMDFWRSVYRRWNEDFLKVKL